MFVPSFANSIRVVFRMVVGGLADSAFGVAEWLIVVAFWGLILGLKRDLGFLGRIYCEMVPQMN